MVTYISFGESGNEFPDNFKFTTEECVLVLLKFIFVHAKEFKVDSGNGFDETFERCGELELPEEAGRNASGGGTGETNLKKREIDQNNEEKKRLLEWLWTLVWQPKKKDSF